MPPRRHARSVSRRSTPLSPPKPPPQPAVPDARLQDKRSTRSTSREVFTNAQNELQNIDQALETVNEEADSQRSGSIDALNSPSVRSDSVSSLQNDLDELDRDEIILNLADLHDESIALLSLFQVSNDDRLRRVIHEISQIGSLQQKKLNIRAKKLSASREPFGGSDFINPPLVVRKLAGTVDLHQINYGRWRPDAIIYLANLAQQMATALSNSSEDRGVLLGYLYNNFPSPFVGKREFSFGTELVDDTGKLAIDVVTQFFIHAINFDDPEQLVDPDGLADQVFQNDEATSRDFQDEASQEMLFARLGEIKGYCAANSEHPKLLHQLRESFPWSAFILKIVKWSIARMGELKKTINKQGGVENIVELLTSGNYEADVKGKAITDRYEGLEADEQSETSPNTERWVPANTSAGQGHKKTPSAPLNPSMFSAEIRQLREAQAKHTAEVSALGMHLSTASPAHETQEIPQSPTPVDDVDPYRPLQDDDDEPAESTRQSVTSHDHGGNNDEDELIPTQSTNIVMATLRRQAIEREKENRPAPVKRSLLDRQPNARRVEWQTSGMDDTEHAPRQPTKRMPTEIDDDDEDDDDFEKDMRPAKISRMEKEKQPLSHKNRERSRDVESAFVPGLDDDDHDNERRNPLQERTVPIPIPSRPSGSRSVAPSSSQPAPQSRQTRPATTSSDRVPTSTAPILSRARSPPRTQVARVNEEARAAMALSREIYSHPKAQVRTPWNHQECNRLMEMVERHGTKWARILEEDAVHEDGPLLQGRGQVPLKDKARNIKLDFLKARRRLPPGFELVSIGQRCINQLRSWGIDYIEGRYTGEDIELDPE